MAWNNRRSSNFTAENFEQTDSVSLGGSSSVTINLSTSTGNYGVQIVLGRTTKDALGNDSVTLNRSKWMTRAEVEAMFNNAARILEAMDAAEAKGNTIKEALSNAPSAAVKRTSVAQANVDALSQIANAMVEGFKGINEHNALVASALTKILSGTK
jgi:hypothetical protein